jgi:hypothetical protein
MTAPNRRRQEGQILVLAALVMAFLFVPLAVFVIDTGLVEAGYAQLGETLQASAEDGASSVNAAAYRQSGVLALDPLAAQQVVDRSMQTSGLPGLDKWSVAVQGNTVTVTGTLRVPLVALGTATLTETRSATFAYGT